VIRPIKLREAYRGLRNKGCDRFAAVFVALVWVAAGVQVESEGGTNG
jgi:hypothetical protein